MFNKIVRQRNCNLNVQGQIGGWLDGGESTTFLLMPKAYTEKVKFSNICNWPLQSL